MNKERVFINFMYAILMLIGVLQFFEVPKTINYILGVVAICFGITGYIIKFRSVKK